MAFWYTPPMSNHFLSVGLLALSAAVFLPAGAASAQDIFKYTKADGTVSYTDSLAELPEERRAYYNRQIQEREAEHARQEAALGKDELARREAEAERERIIREAEDAANRAERLAAVEARLKEITQRNMEQDKLRAQWQARMLGARQKLNKLLEAFRQADTTYQELATRASFTLLPGQAEQRDEALALMKRLEPQIDATINEINVKIPAEARRAGIPPGWLRGL